ncbi:MAG: hypothetical protein ACRDBG_03335 [Waterburya sp.]
MTTNAMALVVVNAANNASPIFTFAAPSNSWVINHNSGAKKVYRAFSSANVEMRCDCDLISGNTTILRFNIPVIGYAIGL